MPRILKVILLGVGAVFVAQLLWRRWRKAQQRAKRQLATLEFNDLRSSLQMKFLQVAGATGKPRGLSWKQCDLHDGQLFATDRVTEELYALVGTTISFEAIPGGGMEEVAAVSNLRCATAVFIHRNGKWTTDGRVVFNLEPVQALEHYEETLQEFAEASSSHRNEHA